MDRGLAVTLTVAVGGLIALQAPINAGLGKATGNVAAAFVSFAIGTLLLALLVARERPGRRPQRRRSTSNWYYLLGGVLGVAYVYTVLVTVSTIGAGAVAAATVTGQLTASVIIDRIGHPRPGGAAAHRPSGSPESRCCSAGTYLVVR